jgi:hypothetical protein
MDAGDDWLRWSPDIADEGDRPRGKLADFRLSSCKKYGRN